MSEILLLAGTAEARILAERLAAIDGLTVIASLAGATSDPAAYAVPVRVGGFGGVAGLQDVLQQRRITALIDATHPFATTMQDHAHQAANAVGIPHLRLLRPPWPDRPGWIHVSNVQAAADALPIDARALVTSGKGEIEPFHRRIDTTIFLRTIEPVTDLPAHIRLIRSRPGQRTDAEADLMKNKRITHLIAKNSGGPATGRLDAADKLRLTTIMIDRPAPPGGEVVETVDAAVAWLQRVVANAI